MIFRPYGQTNRFPTAPTQDLGGLVFAKEVKGQRATHNGERAAREIALQRGLRFVASKDLQPRLKSARIYPEILGSDHCPIGLELVPA